MARLRRATRLAPAVALGVASLAATLPVLGAPTTPPKERALEVGVSAAAIERPNAGTLVDYKLGQRWSGHATVVLLPWLGVRVAGGLEHHAVHVENGALGVPGNVQAQPDLFGPHVMAQLQSMWALTPRLEILLRAGMGWQRFTTNPIPLSEPTPLTVAERTGVFVELPFSVGARYAVWADRMALTFFTGIDVALSKSGSLFDAQAGASQAVRQDTGTLLHVAAFPEPSYALSAGLSAEYFF